MSLQTFYRPAGFNMFAGNETVKKSIIEMLKRDNPPDAFLIVGPAGCGKTTLGRIIARGLGCHKNDYKEVNTASDRTIKGIRTILDDMKYAPMNGKKKVVLFDEVHSLLGASQEALLKGLEEPPPHFHFISCTTNPEALKDTFKRRCHIYEVAPLTSSDIIIHIRKILAAEKIKDFPQEIIDKIIELSSGSLGIVLKNLDMVIDMGDDIERALETLKSAGTAEAEVVDICRTIVNFNMSDQARWNRVKKLLADFKGDGESARRPMLGWFTKCLLNSKMDGNGDAVAMIIEGFRKNFYDDGRSGLVAACYLACDTGEREEK